MEYAKEQHIITSWIWMGIFVFGLFTMAISYLVKRHLITVKRTRKNAVKTISATRERYSQQATYLQEQDRKRLSDELHDNVMSRLNVLHLNLFEGNIPSLEKNLKASMRVVRELSHNLTPVELNEVELWDLIDDYLDQLKHQLDIRYYTDIRSDINPISSEMKLNMFRIFQELVSNILKHADATQVLVHLRYTPQSIALIIADNGKGFITHSKPNGIGLRNIKLRVSKIKGHYKYNTQPNQSTRFILYIPQLKSNTYETELN